MLISKSYIRQIILEELNKEVSDQSIQSLINSFGSRLKNLSQELKSDAAKAKVSDKQNVKESAGLVTVSLAIALPKIFKLASEYANSKGAIKLGQNLEDWSETIHHLYIDAIKFILNLIPAYRKADEGLQKKIADTVFIAIVIFLTGASLQSLATAASNLSLDLLTGLDVILVKVKSGEIKEFLQNEIAMQLQAV